MKALITEIGPHALGGSEPMIILFGETATEGLKEHAVIQKFQETETLEMKAGDTLKIGDKTYTINFVGSFANDNLNSISHVTLVFSDVPQENVIMNGLYLSPYELPKITVGTSIDYISAGA